LAAAELNPYSTIHLERKIWVPRLQTRADSDPSQMYSLP
jgi:hypothetical protein